MLFCSEGSATETAVKGARLLDFEVLHFAAHAVEDKRIPERAGLVFYPGSRAEDGLGQPRRFAGRTCTRIWFCSRHVKQRLGKSRARKALRIWRTRFWLPELRAW